MRFLLKQSSEDISEFAVAILEQWSEGLGKKKNRLLILKVGGKLKNYESIYLPTLPS